MILNRSKENKWIFQKNISSTELIFLFLNALKKQDNKIDYKNNLNILKKEKGYKGRSKEGTPNTLGVRMSQMCFYMFGYKSKTKEFIPSISTQLYKKRLSKFFDMLISWALAKAFALDLQVCQFIFRY